MARAALSSGTKIENVGHLILDLAGDPQARATATADPNAAFAGVLDLRGRKVVLLFDDPSTIHIVVPYYPDPAQVPRGVKAAAELLGTVTIMGCGD